MTAEDSAGSRQEEAPPSTPGGPARPAWTFLTNHGHVLLSVAQDPGIRVADIAGRVGITPRAALQILKDLEDGGYLHRTRVGRRTRYTIEPHQHFRHPATASQEVDGLIRLFSGTAPGTTSEPQVDR
ncbi:helix-turn-helix transcriptional regulator [Pseudarthrobacter sp. NS4]|uniref:helix-turn-helix transcriptional regulator n=1 Tax=Pseudarthrobacter sp. NS4 TaxID=2973976 RepID=UPI002163F32C|nr:winged helix-turn-helix domain-containing protein [Pseudarthrobacter sp. NS4]